MKLIDITNTLEQLAPINYAESFDNVGLLVGDINATVKAILITLDTTEAVVEEAIANKCNLIITFHPIIFSGLKKITGKNYVERVVIKAIQHNIAIYAIHTNLDNANHGTNYQICNQLGLINQKILIPKENSIKEIALGMGRIGELPEAMEVEEWLHYLKEKMQTTCVRYTNFEHKKIKKVAVLGGSGSFAIPYAKKQKADVLITADVKYHQFFEAENELMIADIGHYESEQFTKKLLFSYLSEKIPNFVILKSVVNTNPINYF